MFRQMRENQKHDTKPYISRKEDDHSAHRLRAPFPTHRSGRLGVYGSEDILPEDNSVVPQKNPSRHPRILIRRRRVRNCDSREWLGSTKTIPYYRNFLLYASGLKSWD